jgi:acetyl-CoA carboxylase biotin carboxyl carrier protein
MPRLGRPKLDKELIRELAALLDETGLNEIEWSESGVQIRVARGAGPVIQAGTMLSPPSAATGLGAIEAEPALDLSAHPGAVRSPMVGTVYVAAEPGAAPFVRLGDTVSQGQTLLIIEAMKTMNPIPAPRAGRVKQILVENQMPVEYGQIMMLVE